MLRFDPTAERDLARYRRLPGFEITRTEHALWLRTHDAGPEPSPTRRLLAAMPARERFLWLPDDTLRRPDRRIPEAVLPSTSWEPIARWFPVEMPVAAWPAPPPSGMALRLVPSADEREPELVLVDLRDLAVFVRTAPRIRLAPLRYAASARSQALVRGRPLPPVPGTRFVLHDGVAVPAGFFWDPPVSSAVLAECLAPPTGGLVLWHPEEGLAALHPELWLPLTPGSLRATLVGLGIRDS
ncbi:MAG: hypothetical protein JNL97_06420 [Verrucomicrobiales bacterium]|nr:hypothetical protein [Verrucomicrobiales bacterium]